MKVQGNGFFRYILIFVLVVAGVRFFPLAVRAIQMVAIAIRVYWWAILPVLIACWAIWKLKRRVRVTKRSEDLFAVQELRDVTTSAEERRDQGSSGSAQEGPGSVENSSLSS